MNTFVLIIVSMMTIIEPNVEGLIVFRRRAENVYYKVKYFDIEGVGKARLQVLLPVGYNFSITENHGFGVIEVNVRWNQAFISHELGESRGIMSRYELLNGTVYWEFVDDEFYELQIYDCVYIWLSVTKADGSEFIVDSIMILIY